MRRIKVPPDKPASEARLSFNFFGFARDQAMARSAIFWVILIIVISSMYHNDPEEIWAQFRALLTPNLQPTRRLILIISWLWFIARPFFSLPILKCVSLLWLPRILAHQVASKYLADIFELEDEYVAWSFIGRAAFAGRYQTISVKEGHIEEKDKNSPILLIGGPGYLNVNLDSVVLLEKANGEPEIIGSTKKPKALEGFERIRETADGQYAILDLRNQFSKNIVCASRTREGIRVKANDVKALFSIHRGEKSPTPEDPYPFDPVAVESMVYGQVVTVGSAGKGKPMFPWGDNMVGMVRGELRKLISSKSLGEILANTGEAEIVQDKKRQEDINEAKRKISPDIPLETPSSDPPPSFTPRHSITSRFYNADFKENAYKKGMDLSWIDIGNWDIPSSIILQNHLEAWQIEKSNIERKCAFDIEKNQAYTQELTQLLRKVIDIFTTQKDSKSSDALTKELMIAYHQELNAAKDFYIGHGLATPAELEKALEYLDNIIPNMPHSI